MVLSLPSIDSLQPCHPNVIQKIHLASIPTLRQYRSSTMFCLASTPFHIHRNNSDDSASFPGWIRLTPARQSKGATRSKEDEVSLSLFRATNFDAALPS
jgi:hypothetical protein